MSSYRRARVAFAAGGMLLVAAGLLLWRRGGFTLPWTYQGWAIPIPAHFALLGLGVTSILVPYAIVAVAIYFLPDRATSPLRDILIILRNDPDDSTLPANATATQLAEYILQLNRRAAVRLYSALFVFALLFFVALPLVITDQLSKTQFNRDSEKLIDVVQDLPMDFGATDRVRAVVRETQGSINNYPDTDAARLHQVLDDLYAPLIVTATDFDAALNIAYNKHVRPSLKRDSSAVSKAAFASKSRHIIESPRVTAAYLTILALLCNEQGNQGQFLPPYLYARQFLTAASTVMHDKPLSVTSNALGVTYSALLRRHDQYVAQFQQQRTPTDSIGGLEEANPLDCVALARTADDSFTASITAPRNNFNLSRHLNNRSDLRMWLIHYAHIRRKPLNGNTVEEVQFLRQEIDPPVGIDTTWRPSALPSILGKLRKDVDSAFNMSPDPRILITRAQLMSLTGELCSRYSLAAPPCNNPTLLLAEAINDIRMARRMGLSFRFFSEERSDELFMSWLWSQPEGRAELSIR